jgi:hypothetical protein
VFCECEWCVCGVGRCWVWAAGPPPPPPPDARMGKERAPSMEETPSDRAVAVKNGRPESDHSGWDRLTE